MQTVLKAAGGIDGLRSLADAWHRRVMADEVVAHAFSHGFHPNMSSGSPPTGPVLHDYFAWATKTTMSR